MKKLSLLFAALLTVVFVSGVQADDKKAPAPKAPKTGQLDEKCLEEKKCLATQNELLQACCKTANDKAVAKCAKKEGDAQKACNDKAAAQNTKCTEGKKRTWCLTKVQLNKKVVTCKADCITQMRGCMKKECVDGCLKDCKDDDAKCKKACHKKKDCKGKMKCLGKSLKAANLKCEACQ